MSYVVLIPARYGSTRLEAKALRRAAGKPLVQHVHERALAAPGAKGVLVLTDDERIAEAVRAYGGEVRMTRADHPSGTDRCAEVAATLEVDAVVNLQGDEPFVEPADLARLAVAVSEGGADLATLATPFASPAELADPSAVKALVDGDGVASDFQRTAPTAERLAGPPRLYALHHVGIYAFRRTRLVEFAAMPPSPREQAERLEQLRAVEAGWRIQVLPASAPAFGVDTAEDWSRFEERLRDTAG